MRIKLECRTTGNIHIVTAALMAAYYTDITVDELVTKLTTSPLYKNLHALSSALQKLEDLDPTFKSWCITELELADDGYYIKLKEH